MVYRYQIMLLDRLRRESAPLAIVKLGIQARVKQLGLPANTIRFIGAGDRLSFDPKAPAVAFYWGSGSTDPNEAFLLALRAAGITILPLVSTTAKYRSRVPPALHNINGLEWTSDALSRRRIVNRGLEELGLLRRQRIAFVSYKRSEARAVAQQLFHGLVERSYDVFLDTFSVEGGVAFQPHLHDYLVGSDVLVLLDSPSALTSTWVEQEVTWAHQLGMLVVQLVWPRHRPTPGTELCARVLLRSSDFEDPGSRDPAGILKAGTLARILSTVESGRARAFAARRTRLVGEFVRAAGAAGCTVTIQPDHALVLRRRGKRTWVFPVVGHVGSRDAHGVHAASSPRRRQVILYDHQGYLDERQAHIEWLNLHLPIRCISLDEVPAWVAV